jgi:group I intron endonuclease
MMEKQAGIYGWVNLVNGKVYVGSTDNLARRKYHHIAKLKVGKHPNTHLQSAWNGYGVNNFEFIVLEVVDDPIWLRAREHAWILRLQAADREFGYNSSTDAWAATTSEETKAKLRQAWVARKVRGDYYKFSASDTKKGTTAAGNKNRARWADPEERKKIQTSMKTGWTEEARQNRAELSRKQLLERYSDPEERRKHSLTISKWWKARKAATTEVSN